MRTDTQWANTPTVIVFTMATADLVKREAQRDHIVAALYTKAAQQAQADGNQVIGDDYRVQILPMRRSPLIPERWMPCEPGQEDAVRVLIERPVIARSIQ